MRVRFPWFWPAALHLFTCKRFYRPTCSSRCPIARWSSRQAYTEILPKRWKRTSDSVIDGVAIALEWSDLDARLDFRSAGSWGRSAATDIVANAQAMLDRLAAAIARVPSGVRVALSLPTLPLPPLFHTPGWQASEHELHLESEIFRFAAGVAQSGRVTVINMRRLLEESPPGSSFDLKSHLHTGLPYTTPHADSVASQLALALVPPAPEEGHHFRPGRHALERNRRGNRPGKCVLGHRQPQPSAWVVPETAGFSF